MSGKGNDLDFSPALAAPVETRMRWFAQLNSYEVPVDFPVPLPGPDGEKDLRKCPSHKAAFRAVWESLTEAQASEGWWVHALGRTHEEWLAWWNNRAVNRAALSALSEGAP